jgi:CubicO group peptidase (beta-lactamase class C family)
MKRRTLIATIALFAPLSAMSHQSPSGSGSVLCAATASPVPSSYESLIQPVVQENLGINTPGLAIGIIDHGILVFVKGYGVADGSKPVTPRTVFHVASITKTFVGTGVLQLVEEGRVDIDAPVQKYLPYFALDDPRTSTITVRQMLTHTSGMPDVDDYEWNKPQYDNGALERYVRSLKSKKLLFDPGTNFAYSNIAYEVLGDLIAKTSGESFEDFVTSHQLKPLGMRESTLLFKNVDHRLLAEGYSKSNGQLVKIRDYPYNRIHTPSSNLMSSVSDLARWSLANMNYGTLKGHRILKASSYGTLWKAQRALPEVLPGASVAISWFLQDRGSKHVVLYNGDDTGFKAAIRIVPSRKVAVIVLTNSDSAPTFELADRILDIVSPDSPSRAIGQKSSHGGIRAY